MAEVGTYTPPLITWGPISPLALLVVVTGLLSSGKAPAPNEVSDARWNMFVTRVDALHNVSLAGGVS